MFRMGKEEIEAVKTVIKSTDLFRINNNAREVDHFEEEWAAKIGTKYALGLTSGTAALITSLAALGIGPGDEVIVPGYTFMATASAVLSVGAIPVIVEVDETLTIDPCEIEKKITKFTKAIIPVHLNGFPCDMDRIMQLAKKYDLKIVEDACQADGGSYKGMRLGSIGDIGTFSFNYYKIISSGEGGALVTNDKLLYQRALVYHDSGSNFRPYSGELTFPIFVGAQYRSNEILGAILREQVKKLDGILLDLRRVKKTFMDILSEEKGIKFVKSNDVQGDCGIIVALSFEAEELARRFAKSAGVNGRLPIDSGKHVYINWTPILEKNVGHHPAVNPYYMPQNKGLQSNYSKDMCPVTLGLLSRTVFIDVRPNWSDDEIKERISSCKKAALAL